MTHFGTSAKFIDAAAKLGLTRPRPTTWLSPAGRLSTGSPLSPGKVSTGSTREIKADILLASISGGTDIVSCFVLGNPVLPSIAAKSSAAGWAWRSTCSTTTAGRYAAKGRTGKTKALPGDAGRLLERPSDAKYRAAYFERFNNIWCHGDFSELTEHGGMIIYGRPTPPSTPAACASAPPKSTARSNSCRKSSNPWSSARTGLRVRTTTRVVLSSSFAPAPSRQGTDDRIKRQIKDNTTRHVPGQRSSRWTTSPYQERQDRPNWRCATWYDRPVKTSKHSGQPEVFEPPPAKNSLAKKR